MKVTGPAPILTAKVRPASRPAGEPEEDFAAHLSGDEARTGAVAGGSRVAPANNLLALQEVTDATQSRRRAVKRGNDLLDRLDEIRHGLLLGTISASELVQLARTLREQRGGIDDPRLIAVLDDIELRAAVELAKLGH
ncbi:MAG TPA: flagellar assembly protein FliX [Candidatus Cybelea sp.]|nr:flagellar assembly protein FliX [Candidatus Cybelea sp.]